MGGVKVAGDVRISVFQETKPGFSAKAAMANAPSAYEAKGLVLLFAFHTNFLTASSPKLEKEPGSPENFLSPEGCFQVPVEELDKASKNVKKGKHAAGSSIAVRYKW